MKKLIEKIKKTCLISTTKTILLVVLLVALFIFINILVKSLNISSIDVTKENLYSLSDPSIKQIEALDQNVAIYIFGLTEENSIVNFAKLYPKVNDKISVEVVDITKRPDLAQQYGVTSEATGVVIQAPTRSKILSLYDFSSHDYSTGKTIDLTEHKLTNAILDTTISKKPKVYFLTGHKEENSAYTYFTTYLENNINDLGELNLLSTDFPEDCDALVITTPGSDYTEYEANLIISYIQKGGNILWLSNPVSTDYPNVKKVLDQYGVSISKGTIHEQGSTNILLKNPTYIVPAISYHEITENIVTDGSVVLFESGKLSLAEDDVLNSLSVTVNPLLKTTSSSFLRTDSSVQESTPMEGEEVGSFTVGAELVKSISEGTSSKLVIFANSNFAMNTQVAIGSESIPAFSFQSNKGLLLNTIAYLTDRGDTITLRKDTGSVTYSATEQQDNTIRAIIFSLPVVIILIGIIIWQVRRRRK